MTSSAGDAGASGRHSIAHEHREAVHDLAVLHESRIQLVQRLERMVVAVALTLEAEAAAEERLACMEERAGVHRINNRPAAESAMLAQRYRDLLHAINTIDDELHPDRRSTFP